MAPEQHRHESIDQRTDIFAFGLLLYELIAGRPAFQGDSPASLIAAVLRDLPQPLNDLHTHVPLALDRILMACLAKDPDDRWQSAGDLRRALELDIVTRVHPPVPPHDGSASMVRGDLFEEIVDSVMQLDSNNIAEEDQIFSELQKRSMISCLHSYSVDKGTYHWLRLCEDANYQPYSDSIEFLRGNIAKVIRRIGNAAIDRSPDVISLGPGNGEKDRLFLRQLVSIVKQRQNEVESFYYPVDVSGSMLMHAIRRVAFDHMLKPVLKVKAIHGDFQSLPLFNPVFQFRRGPKLYLFLGNTLGNFQDEIMLLRSVTSSMSRQDVLILEVRVKQDTFQLGGDGDDQMGLSFCPLARLGVRYEQGKIETRQQEGFSQVRKALTLSVHYRNACIRGQHFDDIILSCVNYYDIDGLRSVLERQISGLTVLEVFETNSMAFFVAQRQ